ncbi:MAG TPA: IS701 family transposase [Gemmatimonadaceae bacterium]|jgi:SRSO17 transposase
MPILKDTPDEQRLEAYFDKIGAVLGWRARRQSFAVYAMGVLGDGERKSIEPIACRACPDKSKADAAHQRLLHFGLDSPWSDREVRRVAARHAIESMTSQEPIGSWIIDDTGLLKQGSHSVGVQRQYTGTAGKVTNCQIAVSLSVTTKSDHAPIDFELYLPESWVTDRARRLEARIPDSVQFKTKPELALEMLRRAIADDIPRAPVLADSAYGSSREFRKGVRDLGLHYAVGVNSETVVCVFDKLGRRRDEIISVGALARRIWKTNGFRRCTWRKGTKEDLSARFALRRVVPAYDGGHGIEEREPLWLLIEWRDGEDEPANHFLCSLPGRMTKRKLLRLVMQRWRTERVYEDLKGELGFDHYEGRRFPGWHHHVSVVLCCYAFVVAERARRFPPSARGPMEDYAQPLAA